MVIEVADEVLEDRGLEVQVPTEVESRGWGGGRSGRQGEEINP